MRYLWELVLDGVGWRRLSVAACECVWLYVAGCRSYAAACGCLWRVCKWMYVGDCGSVGVSGCMALSVAGRALACAIFGTEL